MTWQVWLRLGRVSNLPTVWTNVLAAATLAGVRLSLPMLALSCAAFSLFYVGGMFLNDAFDRDADARERPERPIPSGQVGAATVFALGYGLLATGLLTLVALAAVRAGGALPASATSGAALAGAIVLYDAWHKENPLSPLLMGLCRVLVYLTVALAVSGHVPVAVSAGAGILLSYLIGLTYVAKQENLARVGNLWPLVFLAAPFVYGLPAWRNGVVGAAVYTLFLVWVGYALALLARPGPGRIPRAVVSLIAGISLLDALLVAGFGAPGVAMLAVVGFALTLTAQRWVPGT